MNPALETSVQYPCRVSRYESPYGCDQHLSTFEGLVKWFHPTTGVYKESTVRVVYPAALGPSVCVLFAGEIHAVFLSELDDLGYFSTRASEIPSDVELQSAFKRAAALVLTSLL
jgi:hypothetical protein